MIDDEIFLTIGIPTWNRHDFLLRNVTTLIAEINNTAARVELFVSDNHSTDATEALCQQLAAQHSFFRYFRQPQNRGANANFQYVVQAAKGKYVWLLGDDDGIVQGCLAPMIADIAQHNFPAVVIGGSIHEATGKKLFLPNINTPLLTDETLFKQYSPLEVGGKISVLVFNRDCLAAVLADALKIIALLQTGWPHVLWLILVLSKWQSILILPYGTNYYLQASQYNLLYRGTDLANLYFGDYNSCVVQLKSYLSIALFQNLQNGITRGQQSLLLKCLAYSTFTDSYVYSLRVAANLICKVTGFKNKMNLMLFYALPLLLPRLLRKILFALPAKIFPRWKNYHAFMERVYFSSATFNQRSQNSRETFRRDWL